MTHKPKKESDLLATDWEDQERQIAEALGFKDGDALSKVKFSPTDEEIGKALGLL
jgi:hypothetical protein